MAHLAGPKRAKSWPIGWLARVPKRRGIGARRRRQCTWYQCLANGMCSEDEGGGGRHAYRLPCEITDVVTSRQGRGEHQRARPNACAGRSLVRANRVLAHIWGEDGSVLSHLAVYVARPSVRSDRFRYTQSILDPSIKNALTVGIKARPLRVLAHLAPHYKRPG
jgi:hypothetical protein